ncbi:hypothetical protein IFR05_017379, partial [Cadophora sp. M221]
MSDLLGETSLTPSQDLNLTLSDLFDPALQAPDAKKRKRHGEDDEEDEFFTSKKQKKKAKIKNYVTIASDVFNADDEAKVSRLEKRLPQRSAGQPGIYTDLGKEAVPIKEDDLIPVYSVAPYSRKRKIGIETKSNASEPTAQ